MRARIAYVLSVPVGKVIVRWLDHSGQYGRTTFGGDGAEADAAILSKLTGKPVRVQWTLPEDMVWSSVSPAWVSDMIAAVDAKGRIVAFHSAQYAPHMEDPRPIGALMAGMPSAASKPGSEAANALVPPAVAAALFDATGVHARRIPLTPAYVSKLLKA